MNVTKDKKMPGAKRANDAKMSYIFRCLMVLESNGMNMNKTAKEIGLPYQTMRKWRERYWDEYLKHKEKTIIQAYKEKEDREEIKAENVEILKSVEYYRDKVGFSFDLLLSRINDVLQDPERANKVKFQDLLRGAEILAPYLVDKQHIEPVTQGTGHTTLLQTIIQNINRKMPKQETNSDKT